VLKVDELICNASRQVASGDAFWGVVCLVSVDCFSFGDCLATSFGVVGFLLGFSELC
jgi:hypothetical protein